MSLLRLVLFNVGSRCQEYASRGFLYGDTLIDQVRGTFDTRRPRKAV